MFKNYELLKQFTLRNIAVRYKGSYLGVLWNVLNPLLIMGLYTVVFGLFLGNTFGVSETETSIDYALGIFMGLTVYGLVGETLGSAPFIIVGQNNLVKKVVFPLEVLPIASVLCSGFNAMVSFILFALGVIFFGSMPGIGALWLPLILLPIILLSLGLAWFLSALSVYFRDVQQLTNFCSLALFYCSAIFYSVFQIQQEAPFVWDILKFNPVLLAIELARQTMLWGMPMNFVWLAYLYGFSLCAVVVGYFTFRALKKGFADVL